MTGWAGGGGGGFGIEFEVNEDKLRLWYMKCLSVLGGVGEGDGKGEKVYIIRVSII